MSYPYITESDVCSLVLRGAPLYNMTLHCSMLSAPVFLAPRSLEFVIFAHYSELFQSKWFAPLVTEMFRMGHHGIWIPDELLYHTLTPSITLEVSGQVFATAIRSLYGPPNAEHDGSLYDYDPCEGDTASFVYICKVLGISRKHSFPFEQDIQTGMRVLNDMFNPKPTELLQVAEFLSSSIDYQSPKQHRNEWIDAATTIINESEVTQSELVGLSKLLRPDTLAYIVSVSLAAFQ